MYSLVDTAQIENMESIFLTPKVKANQRNEKLIQELNELNEIVSKKSSRSKNEKLSVLKVGLFFWIICFFFFSF